MSSKSISIFIVPLLLASILSSCIATKSYKQPDIQTEDLYPFAQVALDSTTLANMPWEEVFQDPQLQDLIEEALHHNLELQEAIQQIFIAEADFYEGRMRMLPSLGAAGSISYSDQSDNSVNFGSGLDDVTVPASQMYSLSLNASWELDVWGKLTSAKKASFAALLQTQATRRAIQTRLIAQVANSYYRLLALDRQLEITKQTVANRAEDVQTIKSLKESGLVTGVSVQQSIANKYSAQVTVPELQQQIIEQEHALSVLLGRAPGTVERSNLAQQVPLDSLATGMPAQLLRNRPDIVAAEYSFRSAFALTNNARAQFYPSFRLTAEGGYQSLEASDLLQPGSIFYNLATGLTQPLFNNGQNQALLKRSKARQQQALLQLEQTVLDAAQEVSNSLSQFQKAERKIELSQLQLEALKKAVSYSRELLRYGEANYVEVLTAQQNYLSVQLSQVNYQLQQLMAGVNLYRALGGGWDKTLEATEG